LLLEGLAATMNPMRALVRHLVLLVGVLAVAAPLVLGPAFTRALQALSGGPEHTCACGMRQGKCGCPECARITAQKKAENAPTAHRTFKRTCDDDTPTIPIAPLPPAGPPGTEIFPPRPVVAHTLPTVAHVLRARDRAPPPPPPPRSAAA
jgi:hypothetical protein